VEILRLFSGKFLGEQKKVIRVPKVFRRVKKFRIFSGIFLGKRKQSVFWPLPSMERILGKTEKEPFLGKLKSFGFFSGGKDRGILSLAH
jgi:hypothetical protein